MVTNSVVIPAPVLKLGGIGVLAVILVLTVLSVMGPPPEAIRKNPCGEETDVPAILLKRYVTETTLVCPLGTLFFEAVELTAAVAIPYHIEENTINSITKKVIIFFMVISS